MLPIAHFNPPFEDFFATPPAVNFAKLVASYSIDYISVESWQQLIDLVQDLPDSGIRLLEVNCDRKRNAQWLNENLAKFAQITEYNSLK